MFKAVVLATFAAVLFASTASAGIRMQNGIATTGAERGSTVTSVTLPSGEVVQIDYVRLRGSLPTAESR